MLFNVGRLPEHLVRKYRQVDYLAAKSHRMLVGLIGFVSGAIVLAFPYLLYALNWLIRQMVTGGVDRFGQTSRFMVDVSLLHLAMLVAGLFGVLLAFLNRCSLRRKRYVVVSLGNRMHARFGYDDLCGLTAGTVAIWLMLNMYGAAQYMFLFDWISGLMPVVGLLFTAVWKEIFNNLLIAFGGMQAARDIAKMVEAALQHEGYQVTETAIDLRRGSFEAYVQSEQTNLSAAYKALSRIKLLSLLMSSVHLYPDPGCVGHNARNTRRPDAEPLSV